MKDEEKAADSNDTVPESSTRFFIPHLYIIDPLLLMPEETEIEVREDQERLDEAHERAETPEKHESAWTRWISLSTAIFAVIAAVAALQSGSLVNEALVQKNESILKQAQASDTWAYYQAKGIKANGAQQTAAILALNPAGASAASRYKTEAARYTKEQGDLQTEAGKLEKEREEKDGETNDLMKKHHIFAYCVTFTQVAIALSAIAALTRRRPMWYLSLAVGAIGLVFFLSGFLRT